MADTLLLRALKSQPKSLNLNSKNLQKVPRAIGKFSFVLQIHLKNNKLSTLPPEFGQLSQLECLNIGNNLLEDLPESLQCCRSLQKLHLFSNKISSLSPKVLVNLRELTFLNLNNNQLTSLPPEICRLVSLQHLSLDDNKLTELPFEICALTQMVELHAANNQITTLPLEFGYLTNLEKLHLQKNRIKELPESLGKCYRLRVLDVAANDLRIFPTEFAGLPLKELYCEENPILQHIPVHSVQEEEVLSLKEISARYVMKELKDRWSLLRRTIRHYPNIKEMLSQSSVCSVCNEAFLNTWLECVKFVDAHKNLMAHILNATELTYAKKKDRDRKFKNKILRTSNVTGAVPIRALLCSYKCFNKEGHEYYGVAFP